MWKDGLVHLHGRLNRWIPLWYCTKAMRVLTKLTDGTLPGYDTGVISSVLVIINDDLGHKLSSSQQELVTSLTSGGALVGAIIAGTTADKCKKPRLQTAMRV